MAEKNQQDRGFIQEFKQRSAALGAVLLQNRSHLGLFRFRQIHASQAWSTGRGDFTLCLWLPTC